MKTDLSKAQFLSVVNIVSWIFLFSVWFIYYNPIHSDEAFILRWSVYSIYITITVLVYWRVSAMIMPRLPTNTEFIQYEINRENRDYKTALILKNTAKIVGLMGLTFGIFVWNMPGPGPGIVIFFATFVTWGLALSLWFRVENLQVPLRRLPLSKKNIQSY